jgi:hypothetical protein
LAFNLSLLSLSLGMYNAQTQYQQELYKFLHK